MSAQKQSIPFASTTSPRLDITLVVDVPVIPQEIAKAAWSKPDAPAPMRFGLGLIFEKYLKLALGESETQDPLYNLRIRSRSEQCFGIDLIYLPGFSTPARRFYFSTTSGNSLADLFVTKHMRSIGEAPDPLEPGDLYLKEIWFATHETLQAIDPHEFLQHYTLRDDDLLAYRNATIEIIKRRLVATNARREQVATFFPEDSEDLAINW